MKNGVIGYGYNPTDVKEIVDKTLKRKVELEDLKHIPRAFNKFRKKVNGINYVTIHGASGEEDIPQEKLKVMTDPYDNATRDFFTDCVMTDPIISPATDRRFESMFEDGFHLEIIDATAKEKDNTTMTEDEKNEEIKDKSTAFDMILQKLQTWTEDIDLLKNMRDTAAVSFAQGRAAALITPPLLELNGQLPFSVEIIATEDLREPIVDIGLTKQIVALNADMDGKPVIRPDEMVYITRGKSGFRKDSKFYGTSPLEPGLQISKGTKRIYNYEMMQGITNYLNSKTLFTINDQGDPTTQKDRIQTFVNDYLTTGKIAFAMSDEVSNAQVIQPQINTPAIDILESKLADILLSIVGVPKSMMNREHGLNRDIATIEAIQFKRFVRKPDEQLMAEAYENQLLNPLLSIMTGKPLKEIPIRIKIVRNEPDGGDIDTLFANDITPLKETEVESEKLVQEDAISTFGATGPFTVTSEEGNKYLVSPDKTDS